MFKYLSLLTSGKRKYPALLRFDMWLESNWNRALVSFGAIEQGLGSTSTPVESGLPPYSAALLSRTQLTMGLSKEAGGMNQR